MTSLVRAKFKVESVTKVVYGESIKMNAVCYDDNDENKSFSQATPTGSYEMFVNNEKLFGVFQPGQEYYLDFTPVPIPED